MSLGSGALKVSGVQDAISRREESMTALERGNHPNERTLTGTVTLNKCSGNNLPEKILNQATKCKRRREERVQESAMIRKR